MKFPLRKLVFGLFDKFNSPTNQKLAREIMGKNYFGIEEAIRYFGVSPSKQQLSTLIKIPFTESMLETHKKTHILAAIFPLSILDISKIMSNQHIFSNQQEGFNNREFAKDCGEVGWKLIQKTPVKKSISKNWQEQRALLGKNEEIPSARVMVYTIIGHLLATDERLFEKVNIRCSDGVGGNSQILVGFYFDSDGLYIDDVFDDIRTDRLGLASAKKSK